MDETRDKSGRTLAEVIEDYRSSKYERPSLTADIIIFTGTGGTVADGFDADKRKYKLLMIKRGGHPFLGCWALPGGFANNGETIEQTAARELEEETGINAGAYDLDLKMTGFYSAPGRDPRGWTVTAAFSVYLPDGSIDAQAGDDAEDAKWIDVTVTDGEVAVDLPDGGKPAFDHMQIITEAIRAMGL